jgi:hypothetical protein
MDPENTNEAWRRFIAVDTIASMYSNFAMLHLETSIELILVEASNAMQSCFASAALSILLSPRSMDSNSLNCLNGTKHPIGTFVLAKQSDLRVAASLAFSAHCWN